MSVCTVCALVRLILSMCAVDGGIKATGLDFRKYRVDIEIHSNEAAGKVDQKNTFTIRFKTRYIFAHLSIVRLTSNSNDLLFR